MRSAHLVCLMRSAHLAGRTRFPHLGGAPRFLDLAAAGESQGVGCDVFGDHAARADARTVANRDRSHERDVGTDEDMGADRGAVFGVTVVVTGDRPGADIGAGAD